MERNRRVVFYLRKSTDEEDRQILSLDDQLFECRKLIDDNCEVANSFTESCSAKKPGKRKEFRKMIDFVRTENIDGIISWDAKRLSRNPTESGELQQLLIDKKVFIKTHLNSYDDKSWFIFLIDTGVAAEDIRNLSENVKRGLCSKVRKGLRPGRAPLGYINRKWLDKGEKDIVLDEVRAPIIRKWFEMIRAGCSVEQSLETITKMGLTEPATKKRSERPISRTLAYKIFRNPFYAGCFWWNGKLEQGKHQSIISWHDYEAIQTKLGRGRRPRASAQKDDLGAIVSLVKCAECGSTIVYDSREKIYKNGHTQTFAYYRCPHRHGPCSSKAIRAEKLYDQARTYLENLTLHPGFTDWCRRVLKRRNKDEYLLLRKQREMQCKQLQDIDRKIEVLVTKKIDKWITQGEYEKQQQELMLEQKRIKESLSEDRIRHWEKVINQVLDFGERMKTIFDNGDSRVKKQALRILGSDLQLKDGELRIDPRYSFVFLKERQDHIISNSVGLKERLMNGTLITISDSEVPLGAGEGSRTPVISLES